MLRAILWDHPMALQRHVIGQDLDYSITGRVSGRMIQFCQRGWVDYTRNPVADSKGEYGAQFWLNRSRSLPDAPEDMFFCDGHRGQRIFIIPSRKLVVVRLGFSEEGFDHNLFLKGILAAIK